MFKTKKDRIIEEQKRWYLPQNMFICAAVMATTAAAITKANLQWSIARVLWDDSLSNNKNLKRLQEKRYLHARVTPWWDGSESRLLTVKWNVLSPPLFSRFRQSTFSDEQERKWTQGQVASKPGRGNNDKSPVMTSSGCNIHSLFRRLKKIILNFWRLCVCTYISIARFSGCNFRNFSRRLFQNTRNRQEQSAVNLTKTFDSQMINASQEGPCCHAYFCLSHLLDRTLEIKWQHFGKWTCRISLSRKL